jgi:regulator of replication initiation timing
MKTMTMKTEDLEEKLKTSLMENKLLKSDMADILKKQKENNSENVFTLQSKVRELKNKLKVNEKNTVNLTRNIIAEGHHYCSFHLNVVFCVAILCAFAAFRGM